MIIPDVNVWVDALRSDAEQHDLIRAWVEDAIAADELVGVSELVLSGVLRIMTHPRILPEPVDVRELLPELDRIHSAPGTVPVRPGPRHWRIFTRLCEESGAGGNHVPDAYHAALAIEHRATFVSSDRALAEVPGLDYRHPLG